jgi:hypothetical protein
VSGSTIGGVVGAGIGYWISGGSAQGAQIGWLIGSAVGGYVDPDVIKGPKLTDAQAVRVQEGAPIPFGYGTFVVGGNIIQCGPLDEHKHRERSGKGGPVQENYTYTRTFAVGICEGPVGGVLRIWADGKLVYDARDPAEWPDDAEAIRAMAADTAKFATYFTFYPGSETQSPDPALEALDGSWGGGVGNVPSYRGLAYVVFRDFDVTDHSGAVPQFRFEIACCGSTTTTTAVVPWVHGNTGNTQSIFSCAVYKSVCFTAGWNNNLRRSIDGGKSWDAVDYLTTLTTWASGEPIEAVFHVEDPLVGPQGVWYIARRQRIAVSYNNGGSFVDYAAPPHDIVGRIGPGGGTHMVGGVHWAGANETAHTVIFQPLNPGNDIDLGADYGRATAIGDLGGTMIVGTDTGNIVSTGGAVRHTVPGIAIVQFAYLNGISLAIWASGGYSRSTDGGTTWTDHAGDTVCGAVAAKSAFCLLAPASISSGLDGLAWTTVDTSFIDNTTGGALLATDGTSVLATTLQGVTASLPTAYTLPDVPNWAVDLFGNIVGATTIVTSACQAVLSDVVADFCDRVGIPATRYDVSALTDPVRGYAVTAQSTASANVKQLQQAYFFDFPEWGNYPDTFTMLRAVKRGGATAFTVTEDDFVWSDDDEDVRPQAVEFPKKLHLTTADVYADYNATTQTAERETQNVKAVGEASVELSLATTRDEAAQIADKALKVLWTQAEGTFERELPEEFSRYVPSDCFSFNGKRYLIQQAELADGTVKIKAVRDRPSAYVSTATGSLRLHPPPPQLGLRGPTVFSAMNLPSLRTQDATTGMYVFVCGLLDGWQGCDLQLSTDGGATYRSVATITTENTMGDLTAACGTSGDITTRVYHRHTLESVTDAQIAARANAFAIETGGVAEVGQFRDATDTANLGEYTLTNNTRGELQTTAAAHGIGDRFVLLDHLNFIPLDASLAGKTIYFRPVSLGTVAANNDAYPVVFRPLFTSVSTTFRFTEADEQRLTEDGTYRQVE